MKKVKRSIRMGQRPKWLKNYTCWRTWEEIMCGMWYQIFKRMIKHWLL